jgi:hypothetical protein
MISGSGGLMQKNDMKITPQTSFEQCFQKLKRKCDKCTAEQGKFFDGDTIR